ncbi:hypothetical protein FIT77_05125 [Candidatus Methylopumilus universalis]|uniref:hypothetical protein n=1 Tax=Candidatus Methylopumilus universalis TaxID=2588536 RepID=UPI00111F851B|nr:hypothetical protein [Candidatus Methylopumilus universalis]QDC96667.1 hypothetical protein FIT77_05125 [Candidatus Methylopumilus universalis]
MGNAIKKYKDDNVVELSFKKSDFSFRDKVVLNAELVKELKDKFESERKSRFEIFILSSSIRNKYLDKKTNSYKKEFEDWFKKNKLDELYGSLSNFTKYCGCGEVVNYVATKTDDPKKYLTQLPLSIGSLYELSMVLKKDIDLFKILFHFTPTRTSVDEPKVQWKTKRSPLINNNVTELNVRTWRQKFENPPPPKVKRSDKRTLKFITVTVNGELWDFDKKTGDKVGGVDLNDVEDFLKQVNGLITDKNKLQFKVTDELKYLTEGYYRGKNRINPTRHIKQGKKKNTKKYV